MSTSTETVGKVQIEPQELRKILANQFRDEVAHAAWTRVKSSITLGGALSLSILVALGAGAVKLLETSVRTSVNEEISRRTPALKEEATAAAQTAARAAVQQDITNIDLVRGRIQKELPALMLRTMADSHIASIIQQQAVAQISLQLQDETWRRGIERSVMTERVGNTSLPTLGRVFALTDLLADPQGRAIAVRLLTEIADRLPEGEALGEQAEAPFLQQGLSVYLNALSRDDPSERFAEHEALIRRLTSLLSGTPEREDLFERFVHRFSSPLAVGFLLRRARETAGAERDTVLRALVTHPAPDARERVESILCGVDPRFRADLMRAAAARSASLTADAAGEGFMHLVRCTQDLVAAERLPALETACLPGGDLSVAWQFSRSGARAPRENPARLELERSKGNCPLSEMILAAGGQGLRAPGGWSRFQPPATQRQQRAAMMGLVGLLPDGSDGVPPPWLAALAAAAAPMSPVLQVPEQHLGHLSLLLERLALLPPDMPGVDEAQQRLVEALGRAAVLPGRPAERLLLDTMMSGDAEKCAVVMAGFSAAGPARGFASLAALAESVACVRGSRQLPAAHVSTVLALIQNLAGPSAADREAVRLALAMLSQALGREVTATGAAASLMGWIRGLPAETDGAGVAAALSALMAREGPALIADAFERPIAQQQEPRQASLIRVARQDIAARPIALAPFSAAVPYLDPEFLARVPLHPAAGLAAGGRSWVRVSVDAPAILQMRGDPALVIAAMQPLSLLPEEVSAGQAETEIRTAGTYLVGAIHSGSLASLRLQPPPLTITGFPAAVTAEPVPPGLVRTRLPPDGPRLYPYRLEAGRFYEFRTLRLEGDLDTVITLLNAASEPLPDAENDDHLGLASRLCLQAPGSGLHWLRVRHFSGTIPRSLGFDLSVREVPGCEAVPG